VEGLILIDLLEAPPNSTLDPSKVLDRLWVEIGARSYRTRSARTTSKSKLVR